MELHELTISQAHQGLINKEFSAIELVNAFFEKIKAEDKKILSYLNLNQEEASSQAKEIDGLISQKRESINIFDI